MLIEILNRTPSWVFILFFALLLAGYFQSKNRTFRCRGVSLLPIAIIGLSFYGVVSAFGIIFSGLACWLSGVVTVASLYVKFASPKGVTYSVQTKTFFVPGSWLPLVLMMAIFFTKYAVGIVLARQHPIANEPVFIWGISFCYGLLSGVFLARAVVIWHTAKFQCNKFGETK